MIFAGPNAAAANSSRQKKSRAIAIHSRCAPRLRRVLHKKYAVQLQIQAECFAHIIQQWEFVFELVTEVHIPLRIVDLLERQHVSLIAVAAATVEIEYKVRRFLD